MNNIQYNSKIVIIFLFNFILMIIHIMLWHRSTREEINIKKKKNKNNEIYYYQIKLKLYKDSLYFFVFSLSSLFTTFFSCVMYYINWHTFLGHFLLPLTWQSVRSLVESTIFYYAGNSKNLKNISHRYILTIAWKWSCSKDWRLFY